MRTSTTTNVGVKAQRMIHIYTSRKTISIRMPSQIFNNSSQTREITIQPIKLTTKLHFQDKQPFLKQTTLKSTLCGHKRSTKEEAEQLVVGESLKATTTIVGKKAISPGLHTRSQNFQLLPSTRTFGTRMSSRTKIKIHQRQAARL